MTLNPMLVPWKRSSRKKMKTQVFILQISGFLLCVSPQQSILYSPSPPENLQFPCQKKKELFKNFSCSETLFEKHEQLLEMKIQTEHELSGGG